MRGRDGGPPVGPAGRDTSPGTGAAPGGGNGSAVDGTAPDGGMAGPPGTGDVLSVMATLPLGGQDDGRPRAGDAADPVQRADCGLQCRDAGHAHLEHVALAARDPPAVLDLRHRAERLLDPGVVDRVALDDADERGDLTA